MVRRLLPDDGHSVPRPGLDLLAMDFPKRLATLRNERKMTQQALADFVGIHVSQLRRYEGGSSSPTLDVLRKLAIALSVSSDTLVFDADERGPDEDLRLQFEATTRFSEEEKRVVKASSRDSSSATRPSAGPHRTAPLAGLGRFPDDVRLGVVSSHDHRHQRSDHPAGDVGIEVSAIHKPKLLSRRRRDKSVQRIAT